MLFEDQLSVAAAPVDLTRRVNQKPPVLKARREVWEISGRIPLDGSCAQVIELIARSSMLLWLRGASRTECSIRTNLKFDGVCALPLHTIRIRIHHHHPSSARRPLQGNRVASLHAS